MKPPPSDNHQDESLLTSANGTPVPVKDVPPRPRNRVAEFLKVESFLDIEARSTDWLWYPWAPKGCLVTFDGRPGLAKSTLLLDLAARVTTGAPLPPAPVDGSQPNEPRTVLFLSAEDDPSRALKPRLMAAGADLARLGFIRGVVGTGVRPLSLPDDIDKLADIVHGNDAGLVVLDPLDAFFGKTDERRNPKVRQALFPLSR
jgi:putative DNA primase/helicase